MNKRGREREERAIRDKRGISVVIIILFLLVLSTVTVSFLWSTVSNFLKQKTSGGIQPSFNCLTDVDIDILDACYNDNMLKIKIKNNRDVILGDFLLLLLTYNDKTTELVPTPYHTYVYPYKTEEIIISYKQQIQKIKVIPKIEDQAYLCLDSAPEYENINPCQK